MIKLNKKNIFFIISIIYNEYDYFNFTNYFNYNISK